MFYPPADPPPPVAKWFEAYQSAVLRTRLRQAAHPNCRSSKCHFPPGRGNHHRFCGQRTSPPERCPLCSGCACWNHGKKQSRSLESAGLSCRTTEKFPAAQQHRSATNINMSACAKYDKLASELEEVLKELVEKATLQLEIFRSKKPGEFMRVDKQLELLLGEKERRVGALGEHVAEHTCQPHLFLQSAKSK